MSPIFLCERHENVDRKGPKWTLGSEERDMMRLTQKAHMVLRALCEFMHGAHHCAFLIRHIWFSAQCVN